MSEHFNGAHWIGTEGEPNTWLCFRRVVNIAEVPDMVLTAIAADSKYWLWVNGQLIVREGGLKRGPSPDATYYDELDLAPHLREGENTLAILLWHFGKSGYSHVDTGKASLLFASRLNEVWIVSDQEWKQTPHLAFGVADGLPANYRLSEANLCFDARSDLPGWEQPGFSDESWGVATVLGVAGDLPWGKLHPRPIPQWRDFGRSAYTNAPAFPLISDGQPLIVRLPYNCHFTPYFKIEAPAGERIDMRTDHWLLNLERESCARAQYVTREGVQEHEAWGWINGHEMRYLFPTGVKVLEVGYRETGYDSAFTGWFECDDEFYNRAWEKARRTLYVCMRDSFMDCPDRERAQWWGDVAIQLGECFYALDPASHALARKGMLELANWQKPDGTLFSPIPGGTGAELPTQMLASVGLLGFWNYYCHTGDKETIAAVYPVVKRYLELYNLNEEGMVCERPGEWTWNDWGENKDQTLLYNGWFQLALQGQEKMAQLLGCVEDLPFIQQRLRSIQDNFHRVCWQEEIAAYRSPAHEGPVDDRGQALAVLAGLAPRDCHAAVRQILRQQYYASPYMEFYIVEALFRMGFADDALERLQKRFKGMVDSQDSSLWEFWEDSHAADAPPELFAGSRNHAWSGAPLTLLSQYVAGVTPLEPGYRRFEVRPQLGHLNYVSFGLDTVLGQISGEVRREGETLSLWLQVPETANAVVVLPAQYQLATARLSETGEAPQPLSDNVVLTGGRWIIEATSASQALPVKQVASPL